jgi:cysteine desulfuration protein SufE
MSAVGHCFLACAPYDSDMESSTLDELVETFDLLDEWQEKYKYIIELGDRLPAFPTEYKSELNRVQGCQSNVWIVPEVDAGTPPRIDFKAWGDSQIVRGLIYILTVVYSHRTPGEILDLDIQSLFQKIGFEHHLLGSRANGFRAMVNRIRSFAEAAQG